MVYFGPSRGCETCKRRRKKCDEARPSCMRCTNANRTCGGYGDVDNLIFRQFEQGDGAPAPLWKLLARKCTLPIRRPHPGSDVMPEDIAPKEIPEEKVEEYALGAFFYDYPIIVTNREISRGYLDGLEGMLQRLGLESDLAKACKVVAFANHGIKLRRPRLITKAEVLYHGLLGSLARTIEDPAFASSAESLMIAMLLGLYEIIIAGDTHPGNQNAHARGVAAILQIENSPLDLFGAVHFIRSSHPIMSNGVQNCGIFSPVPHTKNGGESLDDLLLAFSALWRNANILLGNPLIGTSPLYILKEEAVALDRYFARWQKNPFADFNSRTVGHITKEQADSTTDIGCWPGRVDAYFDHYIAGVWNTARTARLLLISLIFKVSKLLNDNQDYTREQEDVVRLVEDIIASIPYHLMDNLQVFFRDRGKNEIAINLGRPVGGLLLMHPIYVASTLLIAPPEMRQYLKECLAWIGANLGIGQASIFAKAPTIDKQYFADGSLLVWAGVLV